MDAEYWNTVIQTEVYRLGKHGVGVWRGWNVDLGGGWGFHQSWENFEPQKLPKCLTSGQLLLSALEAS